MTALRPITPADAALIQAGIHQLAADLGHPDRASSSALTLAAALRQGAIEGLMQAGAAGLEGFVLYHPMYSTWLGCSGVYVQDIWVAPAQRGTGLGARLLSAAAAAGAARGAGFLRLGVHAANAGALGFYRALGLGPREGELELFAGGADFAALANGRDTAA